MSTLLPETLGLQGPPKSIHSRLLSPQLHGPDCPRSGHRLKREGVTVDGLQADTLGRQGVAEHAGAGRGSYAGTGDGEWYKVCTCSMHVPCPLICEVHMIHVRVFWGTKKNTGHLVRYMQDIRTVRTKYQYLDYNWFYASHPSLTCRAFNRHALCGLGLSRSRSLGPRPNTVSPREVSSDLN